MEYLSNIKIDEPIATIIAAAISILAAIITYIQTLRVKKLDQKVALKDRELSLKLKEVDEKIATKDREFSSISSFYERQRTHIENIYLNYNEFINNSSVLYTQIITKLEMLERDKKVNKRTEKKLKKYMDLTWESYKQANYAKRLLILTGYSELAEKQLIPIMRHMSKSRNLFLKSSTSSLTYSYFASDFDKFRELDKAFLESLSMCYKTLIISESNKTLPTTLYKNNSD